MLGVVRDESLQDHPSRLDGGARWSGMRCVGAERTADSWRSGTGWGSREARPAARQWTTNRKETDMTDVGLLYVGGVLFVNAVMLLGKAERRRRTRRGRVVGASCTRHLPSTSHS